MASEVPPPSQAVSGGPELDIVIPVYNEGENITRVVAALQAGVRTPFRLFICYDFEGDDTLPALKRTPPPGLEIRFVKNPARGPHGAVLAGFAASKAPFTLVYPADDDYNAAIIDGMVHEARRGAAIVCASRLMKGGRMIGAPWPKSFLMRSSNFAGYFLARLPTHDASNGFRLFSRSVLETIAIESSEGFTYSIELLVKCHRLGWPIAEVPAQWFERTSGRSRFHVIKWAPAYLRWMGYAFATTYLRRGAASVPRRTAAG